MWAAGNTHGEILEVTELTHEVEFCLNELQATAELVYAKLPKIKSGMKPAELKEILLIG
jgi:hypothetical protein